MFDKTLKGFEKALNDGIGPGKYYDEFIKMKFDFFAN